MCGRPASDIVRLRPSISVFASVDWRLLEKGQASASNAISTFKQLLTVQTKALVQRHGWKERSRGCQLRLVNVKYRLADADKHMGRSLRSRSLRKYSRVGTEKKSIRNLPFEQSFNTPIYYKLASKPENLWLTFTPSLMHSDHRHRFGRTWGHVPTANYGNSMHGFTLKYTVLFDVACYLCSAIVV